KSARNSGSKPPPGFIDNLLDVSSGAVVTIVREKEHLVEPYASDDKRTGAGHALRRTHFEVTGLDNPLKEQLNGFAPICIEVMCPRERRGRQRFGGKQPAPLVPTGRQQVR